MEYINPDAKLVQEMVKLSKNELNNMLKEVHIIIKEAKNNNNKKKEQEKRDKQKRDEQKKSIIQQLNDLFL